MNEILQVLSLFIGMLLRFATPIGLTVLLVRYLYKLDGRWQLEAREVHANLLQSVRIDPDKRCWEVMDCNGCKQENCTVYRNQANPCWEEYSQNGILAEKCEACIFPKLVQVATKI